jgi:hypothetical protein
MYKIYFITGWGESSNNVLKRYSLQTPNCSGIWGNIKGTEKFEEADFICVLDRTPSNFDISRLDFAKVIYLQREPHQPLWLNGDFPSNILFSGKYENSFNLTTWWINIPFDDLCSIDYPSKTKNISCVNSGLYDDIFEHRLRVDFLKILSSVLPDIDIWGRGIGKFINPSCFRGELNYNGNCKFNAFINHFNSIVLENTTIENSWSEKIADPFLAWSRPFYWGDENISNFFPDESFVKLSPTLLNTDFYELELSLSEPVNISALKEARDLVLYKWNLWPTLHRIINFNRIY